MSSSKEPAKEPAKESNKVPGVLNLNNKVPGVLNLNNEVVLMRKEVKRLRALVIRKMTRQISALKKKKGTVEDLERNRRRGERLLEEIHQMKDLKPDKVRQTR